MRGLSRALGELLPFLWSTTGILVIGVLLLPLCAWLARRESRTPIAPLLPMGPVLAVSAVGLTFSAYQTWGLVEYVLERADMDQRATLIAFALDASRLWFRNVGILLILHGLVAAAVSMMTHTESSPPRVQRVLPLLALPSLGVAMLLESMHGSAVFTEVARAAWEDKRTVAEQFVPYLRLIPAAVAAGAMAAFGLRSTLNKPTHIGSLLALALTACLSIVAWRGFATGFADIMSPFAPDGRLYTEYEYDITLPVVDQPVDYRHCYRLDVRDAESIDGRVVLPQLLREVTDAVHRDAKPAHCVSADADAVWADVMPTVNSLVSAGVYTLYLDVRVPEGTSSVPIAITQAAATAVLTNASGTPGAVHSAGPGLTVDNVVQASLHTEGLRMAADPVVVAEVPDADAGNGD